MTARIRYTHPEMVRRGAALHCLPHNLRMHAGPALLGVVKRLQGAVNARLVKLAIKLRKSQIEANKQRAFHAVDSEIDESIARRKPTQVSRRTEPLVIPIYDGALGIDKIQAVVRLVRLGQPMRTTIDPKTPTTTRKPATRRIESTRKT